jgi:hypothetical protein
MQVPIPPMWSPSWTIWDLPGTCCCVLWSLSQPHLQKSKSCRTRILLHPFHHLITLSPLLILPNHRQQKNDSKRDGLDPTYFPNNVFDSSCSDNDKENVHPRLRIFPKTKCNMSKVHGQHCPETTTASNHRRVSYDRLPCLEKIGKDALFDASNNATTNESKTEVSL